LRKPRSWSGGFLTYGELSVTFSAQQSDCELNRLRLKGGT